jgi:pimeloyl-ACP methyl ester carboxylesterase
MRAGYAAIVAMGLATATPSSVEASAMPSETTAPNRFLEKNGVRFAYRILGRKPGVPLVLLAPPGETMDSWDPRLTAGLAEVRPVILFDNVGTTVAEMAKGAETFIDALRELHGTDASWVSGHVDLLGGSVAEQLARDRPDIVDHVVLVDVSTLLRRP